MERKLTETELRNAIYERVKNMLSEGPMGQYGEVSSVFVLDKRYADFIRIACHILAWKGLDFNLNISGIPYKTAQGLIESFVSEKKKAKTSSTSSENAMENLRRLRNAWRQKGGDYEAVVNSEKEANDLYKQFNEEGYYFIKRFLGSATNSSKQMEKEAGLALFGEQSGLKEFYIKNGAVFCVRDFFQWVKAGKPDFERDKNGKLKRGEQPLQQAGITGKIVNKDDLLDRSESQDGESELWNNVKALLDDRTINSIEIAKSIVGGSIRDNQEDFQEIMLYVSEYRNLSKGSKQHSDAFRASAYDTLDKLVEKITEMHRESAIDQLISPSRQASSQNGVNEGRLPDASPLQNEEKSQLIENIRKIKILLAESYELADKVNDQRFKSLLGKMLEAVLKAERDPKKVEAMAMNR